MTSASQDLLTPAGATRPRPRQPDEGDLTHDQDPLHDPIPAHGADGIIPAAESARLAMVDPATAALRPACTAAATLERIAAAKHRKPRLLSTFGEDE
jgi:hypothetical protein